MEVLFVAAAFGLFLHCFTVKKEYVFFVGQSTAVTFEVTTAVKVMLKNQTFAIFFFLNRVTSVMIGC